MKALYFDPILGLSGDMILAALIDLGVDPSYLRKKLAFAGDHDLVVRRVNRSGVSCRIVTFRIRNRIREHDFLPLLNRSRLPVKIKEQAGRILNRIFKVEQEVHRARHLHLHELADADTLLDITGALLAIDYLKVQKIYTRPPKAGTGFITTVEGRMPAFNFATARLLKGFPVDFIPVAAELTTPTGAAILSSLAEPAPAINFTRVDGIGIGSGSMVLKDYPNLLRVFRGEIDETLRDETWLIEVNLDDMNPQDYELLMERLYAAGARDVYLTPVIMKKSRPGVVVTVIGEGEKERITDVLFNETTTLGLRMWKVQRHKLSREIKEITTPYGPVRIKIAGYSDKKHWSLEYDDLKRIAKNTGHAIRNLRSLLAKYAEKSLKNNFTGRKDGKPG